MRHFTVALTEEDFKDIDSLKISRLQDELSAHNLKARRNKSTMIAALREHYKVEHSQSSNRSRFFSLGLT